MDIKKILTKNLEYKDGKIKFIASAIAIILLTVLIFYNIGWIKNSKDLFILLVAAVVIIIFLLTIDWLLDLGEVAGVLLFIILISQIFLGPKMLVPLVAVTSQSMLHQPGDNSWKNWLIQHNISSEKIENFPLKNGFDRGDMIFVITPDGKGEIFGFKFSTIFSETKIGDVIIYNRDKAHGNGEPIIHRVVGIVRVENWTVGETEGTLDCLTLEDFNKKYIPLIVDCINKKEKCPYNEFPNEGNFNFYITKGDNNRGTDQCGSIAYPVNEKQLSARGWIRLPYIGWLKLILNSVITVFMPH